MCRMAAFSLKKVEDISWVIEYVKQMARFGKKGPHCDGWGYVLLNTNKKVEYKSISPAYDDNKSPNLNDEKFEMGIVHARLASDGLDKTRLQLHPFYKDGKYFAHNGTIITANRQNPYDSDTYDFFKHVASFENFGHIVKLVREYGEENEFSGMNFLMIDDLTDELYVGCYYTPGQDRKDYFTLFYGCDDERFFVFSERPVNDYSKIPSSEYRLMQNGEIFKVSSGKIVERGNVFDV